MNKSLIALSLFLIASSASAQSLQDQLATIDQVQQDRVAAEQAAQRKAEAEMKAEEERELKQQDAEADNIQAKADATRNVSEGTKSMMTSEGKAKEKKASSWFSSDRE